MSTNDLPMDKRESLKKRTSLQNMNKSNRDGNDPLGGDELEQYCQKKGLCPLCAKTRTRKRVFQLFKRKNKWELLTLLDKDGSYQVYKGYCVKPNCFTLEQAKRMSGETVIPTIGSRKRQMQRKASRDRSVAHQSSIKTEDSENDSHDEEALGNHAVHKSHRESFPPPELRNTANFVSSDHEPLFVIQKAVEGLANCSNAIRILELSGLQLRSIDFEALAGGLIASTSLSMLVLEDTKLDDDNLSVIASGLERAHDIPLTKLYLRSNQLGDRGVGALCPFLQANTSLEKFDVSRNGLTSLGAILIFSAFLQNRLTRIRSLNISHNTICDIHDEVSGLEPFLARNRSLHILNMEGNNLGDPSVQALADGVKKNGQTPLEQLYLANNAIGDNGTMALADMLENNTSLQILGLGENKIQDAGARAILAALDVNTTIKDISGLWSNKIDRRFIIVAIRKLLLSAERSDLMHTQLHDVDIDVELNDQRESSKFGVEVGTVVSTMSNDPDYGEPSNDSERKHLRAMPHKNFKSSQPVKAMMKHSDDVLHSLELTIGPPYDRLVIFQSTPLTSFDRETGFHRPLPLLDSDHESFVIQQTLSQAVIGKIDAEVRIATLDRFTDFFKHSEAHMLHISCSGPMDRLTLENGYGTVQTLSNDEMKRLLVHMKGNLRVVFVSSRRAISIGQELIDAGAPHVVCCEVDHRFRDPIGIDFVQNFYRALVLKKTLKSAFQIARSTAGSSTQSRIVRRVHDRFQLLPDRAENDPYHNIPVFFAQLVQPNTETLLSEALHIPPLPQHFVGREVEIYDLLEALRGDEIVRIVGPTGSGKKSVIAAVCHYAWKRRHTFSIDRIFWLPPLGIMTAPEDSLYGDLCRCISILEKAQANVWDMDVMLLECRQRIEFEMEDLRLVLVVDEHRLQNSKDSQEGLEKFITFLLSFTNVKIVLIESRSPGDGLSYISHISRDTNGSVPLEEATIAVNPLNFKSTARLFGENCKFITSGGCPAAHNAAEFADLLEPTLRPDSVKITQRQSELYTRMGQGLPFAVISAASTISKEDFIDLIGIANRPEVFVDSSNSLEFEVDRRMQEQLQAVDDKNYLRAFYLDELLVELEMMRSDFPSLEELKEEEESLKRKLSEAVNNRRYDVANSLKRDLLSVKKKLLREQRSVNDHAVMMQSHESSSVIGIQVDNFLRNGMNGEFKQPLDREMTFAVNCGEHRDCSFVVYVGDLWAFRHPSEAQGIVCWTNECCHLEGTVMGDPLLRMGGPELRHELSELPYVTQDTPYGPIRCATGNAVLVGPGDYGNLDSPCIILAVGPFSCSSPSFEDDIMTEDWLAYTKAMLRSCFRSSMVLAKHSELQALALTLSTPSEECPAYSEMLRVGLQTLVEEAQFTFLRDLHLIARTPVEAFMIVKLLREMGHRQI